MHLKVSVGQKNISISASDEHEDEVEAGNKQRDGRGGTTCNYYYIIIFKKNILDAQDNIFKKKLFRAKQSHAIL